MATDAGARVRRVRDELAQMGHTIDARLRKVAGVLVTLDVEAAADIVEADNETDIREVAIERECVDILAAARPGEVSPAEIVAIIKINSDLERAGDMVGHIAERVPALAALRAGPLPEQIDHMARIGAEMLADAVDAIHRKDTVLAQRISQRDDAVDELNEEVFRAMLAEIASDPVRLEFGMHCLIISKSLERIADLATKIARNVIFMATGQIVRHTGKM